jgi:hypothetical protein
MRSVRILIVLLGVTLPLTAGSIFGHVRLSNVRDCESLQVQLRALDSALVIPLRVDNQCRYGQADITPGIYELTAQAHGYYDYASSSFQITPSRQVLHDAVLTRISPYSLWGAFVAFLFSNLGAVIAFFALLLAAFELPRYIKRPTFTIYAKPTEPYCHTADVVFRSSAAPARYSIHFCRVWVANDGNHDAYHVEAFASRVFREEAQSGGGRKFKLMTKFRPLNLRWANSWQISKDPVTVDTDSLVKNRISTCTGRFLDLGFLVDPTKVDEFAETIHLPAGKDSQQARQAEGNVVLFLTLDSILDDSGGTLGKGKYLLEIMIDCDTIDAQKFYLYIEIVDWKSGQLPDMEIRPASDIELRAIAAKRQHRSLWMQIVSMRRQHGAQRFFIP